MGKYNVAVVGLGNWGKILLTEFVQVSNVCYSCSKGKESNLAWLKKNHSNITHTTDFQQILSDPKVNIVVIAAPIATHYSLAKQALEAGKHVFLEKPPTDQIIMTMELHEIAKRRGLLLYIDHVFLHDSNLQALKNKLQGRKIYTISTVWQKYSSSSEDIYWNLLYHFVYIILEFIPDINIISTKKVIDQQDKIKIEITASSVLFITMEVNRHSDITQKNMTITTSTNKYLWDDQASKKSDENSSPFNESTPVSIMIKDFLDMLKNSKIGLIPHSAIKTSQIIELIQSSD